jgi:hypothetical protein
MAVFTDKGLLLTSGNLDSEYTILNYILVAVTAGYSITGIMGGSLSCGRKGEKK